LSAAAFAALLAMSHSHTSLLFVSLFLAAALAPTTTLADALALRNVSPGRDGPFRYGAVRGAGSAAFIVGSLLAGEAIGVFGTSSVLLGQGAFLILAAFFAAIVPHPKREPGRAHHKTNAFIEGLGLVRNRPFRLVVIIAAIVLGSHAMHDSFAMISWKAAGISPVAGSVLWSESVAAEVFVFVIAGPKLLGKVHPSTAIAIGAVAAAVRWTVLAQPSHFLALALAEPLHGLSFALLHLACMRILVRVTPLELAGTAQSTYAFGIGASSALLTFAAGFFYEHFGPIAFLAMAVLALVPLPLVVCLNRVFEMAPPNDLTERMG
jgi:PPP family 3-phenylpropionic acid transporter